MVDPEERHRQSSEIDAVEEVEPPVLSVNVFVIVLNHLEEDESEERDQTEREDRASQHQVPDAELLGEVVRLGQRENLEKDGQVVEHDVLGEARLRCTGDTGQRRS